MLEKRNKQEQSQHDPKSISGRVTRGAFAVGLVDSSLHHDLSLFHCGSNLPGILRLLG